MKSWSHQKYKIFMKSPTRKAQRSYLIKEFLIFDSSISVFRVCGCGCLTDEPKKELTLRMILHFCFVFSSIQFALQCFASMCCAVWLMSFFTSRWILDSIHCGRRCFYCCYLWFLLVHINLSGVEEIGS